jgi:hypothetical protein
MTGGPTTMNLQNELAGIERELRAAIIKFPTFPIDPIHAAAIVVEEAGELQQAALQLTYEDGDWSALRKEYQHTAAMALRFLLHISDMEEKESVRTLTDI